MMMSKGWRDGGEEGIEKRRERNRVKKKGERTERERERKRTTNEPIWPEAEYVQKLICMKSMK